MVVRYDGKKYIGPCGDFNGPLNGITPINQSEFWEKTSAYEWYRQWWNYFRPLYPFEAQVDCELGLYWLRNKYGIYYIDPYLSIIHCLKQLLKIKLLFRN